jgi:translation initiation factor IF-2
LTKHLKLTIKNTQIAEAINLGSLKDKLAKKKEVAESQPKQPTSKAASKVEKEEPVSTAKKEDALKKEDAPRIRARSKSVFADSATGSTEHLSSPESAEDIVETPAPEIHEEDKSESELPPKKKTGEELRRELFGDDAVIPAEPTSAPTFAPIEEVVAAPEILEAKKETEIAPQPEVKVENVPVKPVPVKEFETVPPRPERQKLGPTGRHIKDLLPPPRKVEPPKPAPVVESKEEKKSTEDADAASRSKVKNKPKGVSATTPIVEEEDSSAKKGSKTSATKEFRDIKPTRRTDQPPRSFNARDRQGLKDGEEDQRWRKKRNKSRPIEEAVTIRPTSLSIRTPISIKDLASEMKLKASQLISKLFLQGVIVTLNDLIDDETTIQLLGQEFGCEITIDTSEEQRIRITDKSVKEEISTSDPSTIITRAPVVAFMGHVDHGKTSLIDAIRKSNRVAGEAGAITQHIGAFRCSTSIGDLTILDTPGHEAFSAMRARGAEVTDIVVLVVAGDEGIRQQTIEAIHHAKQANVTMVIAINKSDKPNYNPETVYRQLSDQGFLPEVWGGQTLTVNCSAVTGAGIDELLEMLALQAEVLELKANPSMRARGTVLESEMHKGMGSVATVLVQNGTLKLGDALVFDHYWGRVKTMQDEFGKELVTASPSTPVAITGLSGLPEAGQEFIVVKNEREAREIAEARMQGMKQSTLQQKKKLTVENLFQQATPTTKKILNIVLRADVQGSLEALKAALEKIESTKAEINIIFAGVGEVSESDIQLASTSKAIVVGFHTQIESHAESLVKQLNIQVRLHDIIYHAIDDVKVIMKGLLDKIALETDKGKIEVRALFKSSQVGTIAGCTVTDGTILRSNMVRVMREGTQVAKTQISSLKRVKDDVREVSKGMECGIVLNKFEVQIGDILEAYEVTYITQEL